MDQRIQLIAAWRSGRYNVSELSRRFGVSRKTLYKWIERYAAEGVSGLQERSRAPHHHPHALDPALQAEVIALKHRFPYWGPRKLRDYLHNADPQRTLPAPSSLDLLLRRHGLTKPRRPRLKTPPHSQPLAHAQAPNDSWSADFKGQFRLGNGQWCYPLTLSDNWSRYLLTCHGLAQPTEDGVWPLFERAFRDYGLPRSLRTDNGAPFASVALGGLTRLSVWLIKLGITPERIRPGRPDQNGRHERMHRTLKQHTATPPRVDAARQQQAFDAFRQEYNQIRPHEALAGQPPAAHHHVSSRAFPNRLPSIEYDSHLCVRRVRSNGEIKWRGGFLYVSQALRGERIGLSQLDESTWALYFAHLTLAIIDTRLGKLIRPA